MQICVISFLHCSSASPRIPVRSNEDNDSAGKQENNRRNEPSFERRRDVGGGCGGDSFESGIFVCFERTPEQSRRDA